MRDGPSDEVAAAAQVTPEDEERADALHAHWGLRCAEPEELAAWLAAYRLSPTRSYTGGTEHVRTEPIRRDYCGDALKPWCEAQRRAGRCVARDGPLPKYQPRPARGTRDS